MDGFIIEGQVVLAVGPNKLVKCDFIHGVMFRRRDGHCQLMMGDYYEMVITAPTFTSEHRLATDHKVAISTNAHGNVSIIAVSDGDKHWEMITPLAIMAVDIGD